MFANPQEILFQDDEGQKDVIQILRPIKAEHGFFGEFDLTVDVLKQMVKNFKNRARGTDIPVNYSHDSGGKAAGWMKEVYIDGEKLMAKVEWTSQARLSIDQKEYRYISAEFNENYKCPETDKKYGAVLLGAALTNIPFVKGMDKVLSESVKDFTIDDVDRFKKFMELKKDDKMDFEQIEKSLSDLTDDQKTKLANKLGMNDDKKLSDLEAKVTKLSDENKTLSDERDLLKNEIKFSELVSSGKAVPSQKEAFLAGDMAAFAEKAVKVNLDAKGTSVSSKDDDVEEDSVDLDANAAQEKIISLAKDMMKENNKLNLSEAISRVRYQNPDLVKAIK